MLEAMQEYKVTVVGKTSRLDPPFFVLATQNPVEQEGTYPLPEAQLDRFMFLVELDYPSEEEEVAIARTTTGGPAAALDHVLTGPEIIEFQELVRRVPVPDHIYQFAARLVRKTRPRGETAPAWLKPLVAWGAGPRAVQYLVLGAKSRAALAGSYMARLEDVEAVAAPVLTHRLITTFAAQAEGIDAKQIVGRLVKETIAVGLPRYPLDERPVLLEPLTAFLHLLDGLVILVLQLGDRIGRPEEVGELIHLCGKRIPDLAEKHGRGLRCGSVRAGGGNRQTAGPVSRRDTARAGPSQTAGATAMTGRVGGNSRCRSHPPRRSPGLPG